MSLKSLGAGVKCSSVVVFGYLGQGLIFISKTEKKNLEDKEN